MSSFEDFSAIPIKKLFSNINVNEPQLVIDKLNITQANLLANRVLNPLSYLVAAKKVYPEVLGFPIIECPSNYMKGDTCTYWTGNRVKSIIYPTEADYVAGVIKYLIDNYGDLTINEAMKSLIESLLGSKRTPTEELVREEEKKEEEKEFAELEKAGTPSSILELTAIEVVRKNMNLARRAFMLNDSKAKESLMALFIESLGQPATREPKTEEEINKALRNAYFALTKQPKTPYEFIKAIEDMLNTTIDINGVESGIVINDIAREFFIRHRTEIRRILGDEEFSKSQIRKDLAMLLIMSLTDLYTKKERTFPKELEDMIEENSVFIGEMFVSSPVFSFFTRMINDLSKAAGVELKLAPPRTPAQMRRAREIKEKYEAISEEILTSEAKIGDREFYNLYNFFKKYTVGVDKELGGMFYGLGRVFGGHEKAQIGVYKFIKEYIEKTPELIDLFDTHKTTVYNKVATALLDYIIDLYKKYNDEYRKAAGEIEKEYKMVITIIASNPWFQDRTRYVIEKLKRQREEEEKEEEEKRRKRKRREEEEEEKKKKEEEEEREREEEEIVEKRPVVTATKVGSLRELPLEDGMLIFYTPGKSTAFAWDVRTKQSFILSVNDESKKTLDSFYNLISTSKVISVPVSPKPRLIGFHVKKNFEYTAARLVGYGGVFEMSATDCMDIPLQVIGTFNTPERSYYMFGFGTEYSHQPYFGDFFVDSVILLPVKIVPKGRVLSIGVVYRYCNGELYEFAPKK